MPIEPVYSFQFENPCVTVHPIWFKLTGHFHLNQILNNSTISAGFDHLNHQQWAGQCLRNFLVVVLPSFFHSFSSLGVIFDIFPAFIFAKTSKIIYNLLIFKYLVNPGANTK